MMRLLSQRWIQVALLLALLVLAVMLRLNDPPAIERMRQLTFDYYNKLMPRVGHDDTLIVDIDEESIRKMGQWPWPRTLVAELPVILRDMGAKAVVFDMVFAEPDRTSPSLFADQLPEEFSNIKAQLKKLPDNDAVFAQKISEAGNVVMGFVGANQITDQVPVLKARILNAGKNPDPARFVYPIDHFTTSLPILTHAAAGNGSFTPLVENDGIVRRIPMLLGQRAEDESVAGIYPTLALEAVRVAKEKQIYKVTSYGAPVAEGYGIKSITVGDYVVPTDEKGALWVYYAGHRPELYVSAVDVLSRQVSADRVKDKIVFIGTSAIGLLDLRATPFKADLPGVEIHAEVTEMILHNQFLQRPDFLNGAELIATILISLFIIFLAPFIGTGMLAFLGAVLIGGGALGGLYAYQHFGYLLDPLYPTMAIITIFILSSILTNLRTEMEKRAVRQAFSHYISPVLMEELASNPDKLKLGGEVREISVMFTDIRNFTSISEGMDPAELIRMMNDFLTPMTSCVLETRGTIDKYMGDAMMAFWNAPLDDPDHAKHACQAALGMIKALAVVNENLRSATAQSGKPFKELKAGIGIHSGPASVGNMGSKQRFAYSALGDTVNLASRIEGQTKGYGVSVLMTQAVRRAVADFAMIEIDLIIVKGRREPERIFALLGDATLNNSADFNSFKAAHEKFLASYRAQRWDEAENQSVICSTLRPDLSGLYGLYRDRIASYRQNPPPADWAGVWVAAEK